MAGAAMDIAKVVGPISEGGTSGVRFRAAKYRMASN
jgi:hypothetical protein